MKDFFIGFSGIALSVFLPFLQEVNIFLQTAGASFGLVLIIYSIIHKQKQIKKIKK